MSRNNGLYLIIGALVVAVIGLGIYVYQEEQAPIYLRREELPLQGRGFIGLGQTLRGDNPWAIHFAL